MSTNVVGWAFLVARGRHLGFRAVLAPDFLVQAHRQFLLPERVGEGRTGGSGISVVHLDDEPGGLTVSFRAEPAVSDMIDGGSADPDGVLTDRHGRPLELLYGVVTRGRTAPVCPADLDRARAEALASYRSFRSDEDGFVVRTSEPFVLREVPAMVAPSAGPDASPTPVVRPAPMVPAVRSVSAHSPQRPAPRLPNPWPAARRRLVLLAIGAMVLLGLSLLGAWMLGGHVHVKLDVDPGDQVSCGEPRTLIGEIKTDGPMRISYEWLIETEDGDLRPLDGFAATHAADPLGQGEQDDSGAEATAGGSEPQPVSDDLEFGKADVKQVRYSIDRPVSNRTYVLRVTNIETDEQAGDDWQVDCRKG
jgi:hypothetical protein